VKRPVHQRSHDRLENANSSPPKRADAEREPFTLSCIHIDKSGKDQPGEVVRSPPEKHEAGGTRRSQSQQAGCLASTLGALLTRCLSELMLALRSVVRIVYMPADLTCRWRV
jgi:hypothetical protein